MTINCHDTTILEGFLCKQLQQVDLGAKSIEQQTEVLPAVQAASGISTMLVNAAGLLQPGALQPARHQVLHACSAAVNQHRR